MKPDSLLAYRGKRFIDKKIDVLSTYLKNPYRQRFRITRKCDIFIEKVDTFFKALQVIESFHTRKYMANAIKKQLEHELYNDLKFNTGSQYHEDSLKDELYGYLKFKTNFFSQR